MLLSIRVPLLLAQRAGAAVYILVVRPALAFVEAPRAVVTQTIAAPRYPKDEVANSVGALNELVDHLRDSLSREHTFAPGLAESCILLQRMGDSTTVILQFNLDCGCPVASERFDALSFAVEWIAGKPAPTQRTLYEKVPPLMTHVDAHSSTDSRN